MTLAVQIHETLMAQYPVSFTNKQLAVRLGAPEPSVRRATLQNERNGLLIAVGYYPAITWQAIFTRIDGQVEN